LQLQVEPRCDSYTVVQAVAIATEISSQTILQIGLFLFGADAVREGKLQWKKAEGIGSLDFVCNVDYDDGYNNTCMILAVDVANTESLSKTEFIRINLPAKNIDIKSDDTSSCKVIYDAVKSIASDWTTR